MVILRLLNEKDVPVLCDWENDVNLQRLTLTPLKEWTEKEIALNIINTDIDKPNVNKYFGISCDDSENGSLIGYTYLKDIDYINKRAFIGKVIIGNKDYREGTTVFEALYQLLQYGFEGLGLNRIEGACVENHYFTPFMLMSFGFSKEGTFREYLIKNNTTYNVIWFSLLRNEYMTLKEQGELKIGKLVKRCSKLIKEAK